MLKLKSQQQKLNIKQKPKGEYVLVETLCVYGYVCALNVSTERDTNFESVIDTINANCK